MAYSNYLNLGADDILSTSFNISYREKIMSNSYSDIFARSP